MSDCFHSRGNRIGATFLNIRFIYDFFLWENIITHANIISILWSFLRHSVESLLLFNYVYVSGPFSSYMAFLCVCLSLRWDQSLSQPPPVSMAALQKIPLGQCCGNMLNLPCATTYSVTSLVNGSQIGSAKSPLWSPVVTNYLRTTVSLSLFRPCLSETMTVTPLPLSHKVA